MKKKKLEKRLAYLEFIHEQLSSEIEELDVLLRNIGFSQGVKSVKMVANEMIRAEIQDGNQS